MKSLILAVVSLVLFSCSNSLEKYNIMNYGAQADRPIVNTEAINKAIRACYASGGGQVIIPGDTFITGTIQLLSNVELHLEPGAVLLGSTDTADYLLMDKALFNEGYNRYGIIYATDARNISITGMGELNGNGTAFMDKSGKPHQGGLTWERQYTRQGDHYFPKGMAAEDGPVSYDYRPGMMMTIKRCERIKIKDVSLKDTPEWTIRIEDSDDAEFSGLTIISNPMVPNSDGIHITSTRNVSVSNCQIFTGDDALIVTGFGNGLLPGDSADEDYIGNKTGYAENVTVTNCILSSRSSCIRVGYGHHPIRNLVFSNIVMRNSNRGIGIFSRDHSSVENVLFENIIIETRLHSGVWWGNGEPIHISSIKSNKDGNAGKIKNIRFSNIIASGESGIIVYGTEYSLIENLIFDQVDIHIKQGKHTLSYGGNFDLRPAFPVQKGIFKHNIPAFYGQHIDGLKLKDFAVKWEENMPDFFTYAFEITNYNNLKMEHVTGNAAQKGMSPINISNGNGASIWP